jgi:predicted O-methyltransferase YrrM
VNRKLKTKLKRAILTCHTLGTRLGVCVLPVHYYTSVPNTLALRDTTSIWAKRSELPGLSIDLDEQVANLRAICTPYQSEYAGNRIYREGADGQSGAGYGYIEAQALHAMVRHSKPALIVEVGGGVSTHCMSAAQKMNEDETGRRSRIICIEPFPPPHLRASERVTLITEPVQTAPIDVFQQLGQGDMLFVDSSHTVKPGGDVNYLILEVLPRLRPGVIVHVHDIFLPYDYQRDLLSNFLFWSETSLLRAFLTFNDHVRIIFCLSQLHYDRKDALKDMFSEYIPQDDQDGLLPPAHKPFDPIPGHFPSSIYLEMR